MTPRRPRQYRIVTNDEKFRIQARERYRVGPFGWWDSWQDLGGCLYGPFWSVKEYDTHQEASDALARGMVRDEISRRPWRVT